MVGDVGAYVVGVGVGYDCAESTGAGTVNDSTGATLVDVVVVAGTLVTTGAAATSDTGVACWPPGRSTGMIMNMKMAHAAVPA